MPIDTTIYLLRMLIQLQGQVVGLETIGCTDGTKYPIDLYRQGASKVLFSFLDGIGMRARWLPVSIGTYNNHLKMA